MATKVTRLNAFGFNLAWLQNVFVVSALATSHTDTEELIKQVTEGVTT